VENTAGESLGRVQRLFESGAAPVLVVVGETERLLPFVDAVVKRVDLEAGKLLVDWQLDY
jgi:16S rRNA processing protein RimM